jgi:L-aspartate semialdehyde sulfurtransferase ferredoxin
MLKRTLILSFPRSLTKDPITYKLVKDYDLMFNILKAKIKPNEQGTLVIQLKGTEENMQKGLQYLSDIGVQCETLAQGIIWDDKSCIHCTACTSLCPTNALNVDRETMRVSFDHEKCIACEICLAACPYKAITLAI